MLLYSLTETESVVCGIKQWEKLKCYTHILSWLVNENKEKKINMVLPDEKCLDF